MIDPGHPFSTPYADVIAALEDRLRYGTEQPSTHRFLFQAKVKAYPLPRQASAITSVAGSVGAAYTVFVPDRDYSFVDNRVLWLGSALPNDGSRVVVEFLYRDPQSGLTDFNEGSVAGTLVRAVAREMTTIYNQMDEAYRRAFIDQASGVALESVVALLGVTRVPAQPAQGFVTYLLKAAANQPIMIPAGSRVADQQGRAFVTQADARILPWIEEVAHQDTGVVRTVERIAAVSGVEPVSNTVLGVWPATTTITDPTKPPPPLAVLAAPPKPFGDDERTITLAPAGALPDPVRIRYRPKSATVAVKAAAPGPESNVNAATVTIMPTPPVGVTGVNNEEPIGGGRVAETDERLRARAKHALERAGNATLGALRFGVLGLEGVDDADVADWASDSSLPPGEVRLRFSAADQAKVLPKVQQVIDQTRAAGIRVTTDVIQTIMVSGLFILVPDANPDPAGAGRFLAAVTRSIQNLTVGAPLQVRRLSALAFGIAGLADVAEAQLVTADGTKVVDPFLVAPGQVLRPDPTHLKAMLLDHLDAANSTTPAGDPAVRLRVLDQRLDVMSIQGTFTLDVTVEVSATLKSSATRTAEVVGTHTEKAVFNKSSDAALTVVPATWAPNFRPVDHSPTVRVKLSATAYPGLAAATVPVTLV